MRRHPRRSIEASGPSVAGKRSRATQPRARTDPQVTWAETGQSRREVQPSSRKKLACKPSGKDVKLAQLVRFRVETRRSRGNSESCVQSVRSNLYSIRRPAG